MAYAALILFKQTLEKILDTHQEIQSLKEKVCYLLDFLEDVSPDKGGLLMGIDGLEWKMRDAAFEGEDVIQTCLSKNEPTIHFGEVKDLQKIIKDFDFISESISKIKDGKAIEPLQPARKSLTACPSRISCCKRSTTVGMNGDFIQIRDQLKGRPSHLKIISIAGMGGIGKTTLATNLYNDSTVVFHFDIRTWVTVSQNYQWQEILMELLRNFNCESGHMSINQLEDNLYQSLKHRRYLIVMDDVWDIKAWDKIKRLFPDENNGSRIILTTRITELARYAKKSDDDCIHRMSFLSFKDSWKLLCQKVFGEETCPSEFDEVGKNIARNCKGLPLAIVVVGGLLCRGSRTRDYWEYISGDVKLIVTGNDDQLMDILSLSYNYLPHHLKACFLYVGVFPENHEILVSRLIKLWVAEGFLKPHHSKSLEEVAEEYLKDLVDRNLLMVRKRDHHGEIKTCIIHDLMRDLCVVKAREERFLLVLNRNAPDSPEIGYNEYRISIHSHISDMGGVHESRVRSFLYFTDNNSYTLSLSFLRFRLLKVLNALTITFYKFPIEILELVSLRYLAFVVGYMVDLPAAIVQLKNLQTLILEARFVDSRLIPPEIWKMPQLRHLVCQGAWLPYPSAARLDREMVNLYTLCGIENLICRKEVFQAMPNLKILKISFFFYRLKKRSFYDFKSFVSLQALETLKLSFDIDEGWRTVPMNFDFPLKLKNLSLRGCRMCRKSIGVVGSLPDLQVLKLKRFSFKNSIWDPNEGQFLELKFLLLEMIHFKQWKTNEMHFPNLQHLVLRQCLSLEEIPAAIGDNKALQRLEIHNCSQSVEESAKLIEGEQRSYGNDGLEIRIYSSNLKFKIQSL